MNKNKIYDIGKVLALIAFGLLIKSFSDNTDISYCVLPAAVPLLMAGGGIVSSIIGKKKSKAKAPPPPVDIFAKGRDGKSIADKQLEGTVGYYGSALPAHLDLNKQYSPEFIKQGFEFGQQGVTGFKGLRDLAAGGEADAIARLRESELGTMTDQAGMTRGLMESLSPEQAAQVANMQNLAIQAAGAEGAYAGRMGNALGMYGIRPQEFGTTITESNLSPTATQRGVLGSTVTQGGLLNPTIQAAEQDAAMANQMAQEAYARRGTLSSQEQRSAQQTAREAAQSAGRLGGNAAIAAEIQNREAALAGRRAQASQAGQQAFDQRQNLANLRFQEQQGLFNQQATGRQIRTAEEQALFNQQLGARDQALQQEQALFGQRATGAQQRMAEQQGLFGQRVGGAQATAEMQQAGLGQLQDIERMRAGLRGTAGEEAMRAYGAAGGFYTSPGLEMLRATPQSYTAGTSLAGMGLELGRSMGPQLDYNLPLTLARERAGTLDQRNLAQYQADQQARASRAGMIGSLVGLAAIPFTGGLSAGLGLTGLAGGAAGASGMSGLGLSAGMGLANMFGGIPRATPVQ
jgi:hypothetical protein